MTTSARILILGASGYLGAHLVRRARADSGRDVVALESGGAGRAPRPSEPGVAWRAFDLDTGEEELAALLVELAPGVVISAAAVSGMGACERDPEHAERLNAILPERLGRWCGPRGVRLVHVSTDLVFGGATPPPGGFTEQHPPDPLSVYGRTKLDGERRLLSASPDALICRIPLLFGDSGGRGLGASDSVLADVASRRRARLFADEWRTPLHVGDAAAALLELAHGGQRGLLHLAGPSRLSRAELGRLTLVSGGFSEEEAVRWIDVTTRARARMDATRPADCSLDASLARTVLRSRLRAPEEALAVPA